MTIARFGRITPTQGDMLWLVGYYLSMAESTLDIPDDERKDHMIAGRKALIDKTGMDFGYDLTAWHNFLIDHKEHGYDHPFAFKGVKEAVFTGTHDERRSQLVRELQTIEKGSERIAKFGLVTQSQLAILKLIGYRLSGDEINLSIPDDERINNMILGRKRLGKLTGLDFGYDLAAWDQFLIARPEYYYSFPYAFELVKQTVQHYKSDTDRQRLISKMN